MASKDARGSGYKYFLAASYTKPRFTDLEPLEEHPPEDLADLDYDFSTLEEKEAQDSNNPSPQDSYVELWVQLLALLTVALLVTARLFAGLLVAARLFAALLVLELDVDEHDLLALLTNHLESVHLSLNGLDPVW